MYRTILTTILIGISLNAMSHSDSLEVRARKNIIRWNVTPLAVIGPKSFVFGYERVLKNNQTISLNVGYLEMAQRRNDDGDKVQLFGEIDKGGFDITLDYRFYFKNRNKFPAPDGLYWGPYASMYNLNFEGRSKVFNDNGVQINEVNIDANLNMYSLGLQLGYQFIIKDRFSVDLMLMGPSFTKYAFKMDFDAEVALDPDDPFYQGMEKLLSTLVPGSEVILEGAEFDVKSKTDFNFVGFRYGLQIGYVF